MTCLPEFLTEALDRVAGSDSAPDDTALAAVDLLDAERRLGELSLVLEAFREAMRNLGILEESRSGQNVYDAWTKLSGHFLAPLLDGHIFFDDSAELKETPRGFEALGARWQRTRSELEAFLTEQKSTDEALGIAPVGMHIGYKFRSRLLLLDHRAERIKVAVDLIRRDLNASVRLGLEEISGYFGAEAQAGGRGKKRAEP